MNDVQSFQLMYARHDRIVARERAKTAGSETATAPKFADALPVPAEPARPAAKAAVAVIPPTATVPAPTTEETQAAVEMSHDQMASLMTAFGAPQAVTDAAPATEARKPVAAAPALSADQAALLLQSFGIAGHSYETPEVAEPEKTARAETEADPAPPPATQDTGRFFPVQPANRVASLDATDAYLGAIRNMDRNLARYGVR